MQQRLIQDAISRQRTIFLSRTDMISDAARLMTAQHVGAVMVVENGVLEGILSERDIVTRVVACGRNPNQTAIEDVMTANPETISPQTSAEEALNLMRLKGFRHLPIVGDGKLLGMISLRDLYATIKEDLEDGIRARDAAIAESYVAIAC